MISLFIDALPVDLSDTSPVQLTYDVRNAQELGSVTGYGSYTVKIPTTPRNERIFGSVWDYDVVDTEPKADPRRERPCILLLDGEVIIRGFCLLLEWSRLEYQIQITGGNKGWGVPFKTRKLREVNLDPTDWRWDRWIYDNNICEYVKSLARTGAVVSDFDSPSVSVDALHNDFQLCTFPYVDWGGVTILVGQSAVDLETQRPACYVRALLLAHFTELGYRVVSNWLGSDDGGKTLAILHNGTFPDATQACDDGVLSVTLGGPDTVPIGGGGLNYYHRSTALLYNDPLNEYVSTSGGTRHWLKPKRPDICYRIEIDATINDSGGLGLYINVGWTPSGPGIGTLLVSHFEPGFFVYGDTVTITINVTLTAAQVAQANREIVLISTNPNAGTGEYATIVFDEVRMYRTTGGQFDLRDSLPDATVADLIRALTAMFNLYFWTDDNERAVYIEPYTTFFVDRNLDITPALDTTRAETHSNITPIPVNRKFRYQDDDADAGLTLYADANLAPFGSYETRPELTKTQSVEVPVFAPTICAVRSANDLWIPTLATVEDPAVYTTEFAPRIVRVERRTSDGLPVFYLIPILGCAGTDYDALTPYVSAVWQNAYFAAEPGSATPERGLTFNAQTDAVYGDSDGLFFLYYEDEVSVLEPGRQIKARFVLANRLTIKKLTDFRTLVRMHGHIFQVVKVDKYQPGGDDRVEATLLLRI
jgi:hypothetical protein